MRKPKPIVSNSLPHIPAENGLRPRLVSCFRSSVPCILFSVLCFLFSLLLFADTWVQTTTSDFNAAGSSTNNTQVINDIVQLATQSNWWKTPADWWNTDWLYSRSLTISNNSGGTLTDYPVRVEPFRDTGDILGNNLNNTGLVASWSMNEGAGATAVDASGNNNTGTLVNSTWTTGRYGSGLQFNASTTRVITADSPNFDFGSGDFTLEGWVNNPTPATLWRLVSAGSHTDGANNLWSFGRWATGQLNFAYYNGAGYTDFASSAVTMNANTWYHIALVRSGATLYFYLNGNNVGSGNIGTASINGGSSGAIIGARYYTNISNIIEWANGAIDEVKIFNRGLSAEEISIHYGSGLAGSWHFSESLTDTTNITADMSGYGNNGTLNNSPTRAAGRFGNALTFNGTNQYVNVLDNVSLNMTADLTVEAWIKPGALPAAESVIVNKGNGTTDAGSRYELMFTSAGKAKFDVFVGAVKTPATGATTLALGQWYHVAGVRIGSNHFVYVNGALDGYASLAGGLNAESNPLSIGRLPNSVYYFTGSIDEIRIYNRALSASEIAARYNSNTPKIMHDYADIRFASSDSTQQYSFYQETDNRFWVKHPSLVSGSNTIQMYYGNNSATAASSGDNTFSFFDDFNDGTLKTGWTFTDNGNAANTYSETTNPGKMTMTTASSDAWGATFNIGILYASQPSGDWETISEVEVNGDATAQVFGLFAYSDGNNWYNIGKGYHSSFGSENIHWKKELAGSDTEAGTAHPVDLVYLKIRKAGAVHSAFWSDDLLNWNGIGTLETITTNRVGLSVQKTTAGAKSAAYNNFRIRKYTAIEPAHTASGTEVSARFSNSGNGSWQYFKPVTVTNNSGSTLTDYQVLLEPFRDSGDFIGDNINNTGLVGSWSFSEGSGATTADASGNNNTGTLNGSLAWGSGKYGNAIQFDGTNDYVDAGNAASLNITGALTIEAWINPTVSGSSVFRTILSKRLSGVSNYQLYLKNDAGVNQGRLSWYNTGSGELPSSFIPVVGSWTHVAATVSGTNLIIYANGVSVLNTTITTPATNAGILAIGRIGSDAGEYFYGLMDEVRIFNRALSAEEIGIHYGSGLVGSWHFSEGAGQTAVDMSGNGNHGQLGSAGGNDANDPVWAAAGKSGNALSFDGIDDYIVLNYNNLWNFGTGNFAIEFWVKTTQTGLYPALIARLNDIPWGVYLRNGNIHFYTPQHGNVAFTSGIVNDNIWHQVVITRSGITLNMYVDAVSQYSDSTWSDDMTQGTNDLRIGGVPTNLKFNGSLDEVRIYSRALSASEIAVRYASGTPKYRYDFADIRFANTDSSQEFSFMQDTDAGFWVKIPSLPAGDTTVNMYYGNSSAMSSSNGQNTFLRVIDNTTLNFPLDEASGTTVYDNSGNKNNGTLVSSPAWATGKFGNALSFNGSSSYMTIANNLYSNKIAVTGTQWVYINAFPSNNVGLIHAWTPQQQVAYDITPTGTLQFWINGANRAQYSTAIPTGQWVHLAWVTDGINALIYKDGTQVASGAWTTALTTSADIMYSFRRSDGATYMNGRLDELTIYDKALSASEISALASLSNHPFTSSGSPGKTFIRKYSAIEPTASIAGTETFPYNVTGTFTSTAKDTGGNDAAIADIAWTQNGSGTLTMQLRAANSDPAGWTGSSPAWEDVSNGDTSIAATGRYIQYRAAFTGFGISTEPVLADVTVTYTVPIIPPVDSVSCDKLANVWYSTATFTFTNSTGFGAEIDRYYYAWDNTASYAFTLGEPVWDSSTPQIQNSATAEGSWYFHYLPYSSTDTPGTAQDMGPFRYDNTTPAATTLLLPVNNESILTFTTDFSWQAVTDTSGITYTLQLDYYTFFGSPVISKTGLSSESYTLTGIGQEKLVGNTTYYWRVIATDGAGNSANSAYLKFITTSDIPLIVNTMTGESYSSLQDAIDGANTVDGDVIRIQDTVAHDENINITKDITLENAVLSPANGFAVTGQGVSGGEVLRNCVITSGGVSGLALGENLTIYNPSPSAVTTIQNSKLVNCLIESGTIIINSTLENCYTEATGDYFVDAAGSDFHLSNTAVNAIDSGKNLSTEFNVDMDDADRGIDIWEMANFDTGAWDIGAYELAITGGYINPPEAPSVPAAYFPADGMEDLDTDAVLIWYPSSGSTPIEYAVRLSTSSDMSDLYYSASNITDTFTGVSGLPYNTVFYWQVKASNGAGESAWSGVFDFTTQTSSGTAADYSVISVSPSSLAFSAEYGDSNETTQKIYITNSGTVDFDWTLTSNAAWLTANPSTGNSGLNTEISISADPVGLSVGQHSGTITITAPDAVNSPVSIAITILVNLDSSTAKNYDIVAVPSALIFSIVSGSTEAQTKELLISHDIAVNFAWTILTDAGWLTVTPSEGTSYQAATLNVTVDPVGLETGVYSSMITVNTEDAKNSPISVPVTVYVISSTNGGTSPAPEAAAAPDKPELLSPYSGAIFYTSMPALQWESVSGATYWLQIGKDQDFTDIIVNKVLDAAQYQAHDLENDALFFWRVKAINSSGMSDWSDTNWFRLSSNSESGKETPKACFLTKLRIKN